MHPQVAAFPREVGVLAAAEGAGEMVALGEGLDPPVLVHPHGSWQEPCFLRGHHFLAGLVRVMSEDFPGQGQKEFLEELFRDRGAHDEGAY